MVHDQPRCSTGIVGLDEILLGGLVPGRAYLVRGGTGTGKTTLGLHFLQAGAARGQSCLLITLESSERQVREDAEAQGLHLSGVAILDLSPTHEFFATNRTYDIFLPADVERGPTTRTIVEALEKHRPERVFVDAITTMAYLVPDALQFRKQSLSFLRYLLEQGATVLMSSEPTGGASDTDLQFVSDGILELEVSPIHGTERRSLTVRKLRGSDFAGGRHSMRLTARGIEVYHRLGRAVDDRVFHPEIRSSGLPELDEMLGGGIERGTITILSGPSGVGKTTLGMQLVRSAAAAGERSVVYAFEERPDTILHRCEGIGMRVRDLIDAGQLSIVFVEPLRYSPDEFAAVVRREVEERGARTVMVDGVDGYQLTLAGDDLVMHLHALGRYLTNKGVSVVLVNEVTAITGHFTATDVGISYLSDNLIFLRYVEIDGELRKSIGVLKKRIGDFAKTLHEMEITSGGIRIGAPLTGLRAILSGTPEWVEGRKEPRAE